MSNYLIERYLHGQATAQPMSTEQAVKLVSAFMRLLAHHERFMSLHEQRVSVHGHEQG